MPLHLITGPINSGKTRLLLEAFLTTQGKCRGRVQRATYIVPTQACAAILKREALKYTEALIGDSFTSWSRFIARLAQPTRLVLTPTQCTLLVYKLLSSQPLKYFHRISFGIARKFSEAILTLKKNGINPARLKSILSTRGSLKENDLLTIFECYEDEKKARRLLDEGDICEIAEKKIRQNKLRSLSQLQFVAIDEFDRFAPGQRRIIKALRDALPNTEFHISFPTPEDDGAIYSAYLKKGLSEIKNLADKTGHLKAQEIQRGRIVVASARSPIQEVRAVVDMLSENLPNTKCGDDILVAYRGSYPFIEALITEAKSCGILPPKFTDSRLLAAPIVHEIISPKETELWPIEAPFETYTKLCRSALTKRGLVDKWTAALCKDSEERIPTNRSLSVLSNLEALLCKISITARLLDLPMVRRETFILLLAQESGGVGPPIHLLDHTMPFRVQSFDSVLPILIPYAFIPGMRQGCVPHIETERLFFSEADRLSPEPDPTIDEIFPAPDEMLSSEAYKFATYIRKCTAQLTLTYPAIDESGAEVSKSSFLDSMPKEITPPSRPAPASVEKTPGWQEKSRALIEIEFGRAGGELYPPSFCGVLTNAEAKEIVRKRFTNHPLSPTTLEKYAQCPFTFFVDKVLGLKPKDEEMPEILPKDRGTIVHALLEVFYREYADDFKRAAQKGSPEEDLKKIIRDILDRVLEENAVIVGKIADGLKVFQYADILTMAWQAVRLELYEAASLPHPLFPSVCEWTFGTENSPVLSIPVEGEEEAQIEGRVDRIDSDDAKSHFLVVDYKTGRDVDSIHSEILAGTHLQIPIYVEAVRRLLIPKARPLGGLLLAVQMAEKRHGLVLKDFNNVSFAVGRTKSAVSEEKWDKAIRNSLEAVARHVSSIRKGRFETRPNKKCPRYCNYEGTCRYRG